VPDPAASVRSVASIATTARRSAGLIPRKLAGSSAMLSWRKGAEGVGGLGSGILLLLGDGRITRRASSLPAPRQQVMKIRERRRRHPWRAELHACAGHGVQHPRGQDDDHAGLCLDMDKTSGLAILAALPTQALAVKRMPTVMNHDFLPDMGRMGG
jgi:hypothetical protein